MEPRHGVAGIDPHKRTATICLIHQRGEAEQAAPFDVTPDGITETLSFLGDSELVIDRIGIEGSSGLGQPLTLALAAAGYDVREVQPNRTAERRRRRRRAKTDTEDAEAIARRTLADPHLPPPASTPPRTPPGTNSPPSTTGGPPSSCSEPAS
ncbi:IS110 family transposase [Streptomyces turgidiscabies]|uniref:Transposase n=1 Tax=Streptomyces turgidiscabies TaxID=85558 RepID=A0ABU0S1F7_9ACTN|nr:transposase [Streptomyces turgidiscabies]MDQ0938077.1 transposase [Streptomyces turgidiscabies]